MEEYPMKLGSRYFGNTYVHNCDLIGLGGVFERRYSFVFRVYV